MLHLGFNCSAVRPCCCLHHRLCCWCIPPRPNLLRVFISCRQFLSVSIDLSAPGERSDWPRRRVVPLTGSPWADYVLAVLAGNAFRLFESEASGCLAGRPSSHDLVSQPNQPLRGVDRNPPKHVGSVAIKRHGTSDSMSCSVVVPLPGRMTSIPAPILK